MIRIYAKPSPIRTLTVGFGFAPNLSNSSPRLAHCRLAGLTKASTLRLTAGRELHPAPKVSVLSMSHTPGQMQEQMNIHSYATRDSIALWIFSSVKLLCQGHSIFCSTIGRTSVDHTLDLTKSLSQLTGMSAQCSQLHIPLPGNIDGIIWFRRPR